jgi:glutathione S-transferase
MKLYHALTSPFVRKVMVAAHELGLDGQIELLPHPGGDPLARSIISECNPTGKVPTLLLASGEAVFDSPVICEVLNHHDDAVGSIYPSDADARRRALVIQALSDGLIEAAIIARQEQVLRAPESRWTKWSEFQLGKVSDCVDRLETYGLTNDSVTIAEIAAGCALGYLDFRFSALGWRSGHPNLAAWFESFANRKSMVSTDPNR